MATKKQRERAQRQAAALQAESSAARLISGSDAPAVVPDVMPTNNVNVAAQAPGTAPQSFTNPELDAPTRSYMALQQAIESGKLTYFETPAPATGSKIGTAQPTVVSRVDRYGRTVEVFTSGPQAGTIVGSGGVLYEPPQEEYAVPTDTEPKMPKGIAGMKVVPSPTGTGYSYTPDVKPEDAIYKIALQRLSEYGLAGIADSLRRAREAYPELEVTDLLFLVENDERYNQPFRDRFKANDLRIKNGLPKLSAKDYLALEQGYKKLFTTYSLPMFRNQEKYDTLIAGDVDLAEATDRVVMAYDRVITDTSTRNAFRQYYGSLEDADIVSALLDPTQQIPALERKVVAAEIGGQALRQSLGASLTDVQDLTARGQRPISGYSNVQRGTVGSEALAGEGVTEAAAAAGYERIAEQLPAAEKLSAIYGGRAEQVSQRELEQAEILGLESAKRKQRKLAGMEEATFSGQAGTMRTSLGRRGRQGAF